MTRHGATAARKARLSLKARTGHTSMPPRVHGRIEAVRMPCWSGSITRSSSNAFIFEHDLVALGAEAVLYAEILRAPSRKRVRPSVEATGGSGAIQVKAYRFLFDGRYPYGRSPLTSSHRPSQSERRGLLYPSFNPRSSPPASCSSGFEASKGIAGVTIPLWFRRGGSLIRRSSSACGYDRATHSVSSAVRSRNIRINFKSHEAAVSRAILQVSPNA